MAKLDLDHLEQRLLDERERTLANLREAEAEESEGQRASAGELSRTPDHQADVGSDTQEEEKDWATVTRSSDQLARIDEALRLLREDPDDYGVCEVCGRDIEPERLDIVPWTRLCASDARDADGPPRRAS